MENDFLKFEKFISDLKPSDRVGFLTHNDTDGLTAGLIAMKSVERILGKKMPYLFFQHERGVTSELKNFVENNKLTKLIVTDFNMGKDENALKKFTKNLKILILDHHPFEEVIVENLSYICSHNFKDLKFDLTRYAGAKLTYDFFSRVMDIKDLDWLTACGIIADICEEPWQEFIKSVETKYKIKHEELKKVSFIINSCKAFGLSRLEEGFWTLYDLKGPKEIENSILMNWNREVEDELKRLEEDFKVNSVYKEGLHLFKASSKLHVFSAFSTRISVEGILVPHNNVLIIVSEEEEESDYYFISARDHKQRVGVNILLKETVKNLKDASAGGHAVASGGKIRKEDFEKFKEKLFENYKKLKKF